MSEKIISHSIEILEVEPVSPILDTCFLKQLLFSSMRPSTIWLKFPLEAVLIKETRVLVLGFTVTSAEVTAW